MKIPRQLGFGDMQCGHTFNRSSRSIAESFTGERAVAAFFNTPDTIGFFAKESSCIAWNRCH